MTYAISAYIYNSISVETLHWKCAKVNVWKLENKCIYCSPLEHKGTFRATLDEIKV
jgi:hypothetical protein